jgi:hypothetical protein
LDYSGWLLLSGGRGNCNVPSDVWKHIDKRGQNECWPWLLTTRQGYGVFRIQCKYYKAHRVVYFAEFGGIELNAPSDKYAPLFVLHKCNNPLCCNPSHLYLGGIWENMADKVAAGRQYRGGRYVPR